jgi:hypothetical protein
MPLPILLLLASGASIAEGCLSDASLLSEGVAAALFAVAAAAAIVAAISLKELSLA